MRVSDQTARMCELIRVFAGRTNLIVGFVVRLLISFDVLIYSATKLN